ncbi:hypothetical protein U0070_009588, partial [Myodes glareolus]
EDQANERTTAATENQTNPATDLAGDESLDVDEVGIGLDGAENMGHDGERGDPSFSIIYCTTGLGERALDPHIWEAHIGCSVLDHGVVFDIQHSERITAQEDKPKPWQRQGRRGSHCSPSFAVSPKVNQKNEAGKLANEDIDPVNKSGGEAKKKGIPRLYNLVQLDKATNDKLYRSSQLKEVMNQRAGDHAWHTEGTSDRKKRGAYRELEQQMYSEHIRFCLGSFLPLPIKFEMQLNHGNQRRQQPSPKPSQQDSASQRKAKKQCVKTLLSGEDAKEKSATNLPSSKFRETLAAGNSFQPGPLWTGWLMHSLSVVLTITFLFAKEGNVDESRFYEGAEKAPWLAESGLTHREEARKRKRSLLLRLPPILKAAELPLNGCAGNRMIRRKLPTTASFAAYPAVHGKWKAMASLHGHGASPPYNLTESPGVARFLSDSYVHVVPSPTSTTSCLSLQTDCSTKRWNQARHNKTQSLLDTKGQKHTTRMSTASHGGSRDVSTYHPALGRRDSRFSVEGIAWKSVRGLSLQDGGLESLLFFLERCSWALPTDGLQDLNDNVLKLDVHDGCHRFFLRPQQGGSKHHAKVCHSHQILLVVVSNTGNGKKEQSRVQYKALDALGKCSFGLYLKLDTHALGVVSFLNALSNTAVNNTVHTLLHVYNLWRPTSVRTTRDQQSRHDSMGDQATTTSAQAATQFHAGSSKESDDYEQEH